MDPEAPTPPAGPPPLLEEVDPEAEIAPGTVIGEFRVEATLGRGGMATVYSAVQPLIGKRAAIKVLSRTLCFDERAVARFVQEARAVNEIGHPNIVDAFAFGTLDDGRPYIVMEWLQGTTLAERLHAGPLPVDEAIAIIFQMCDGLAAAHDKGIVHRDLKPENVFLVPVRNRRLLVKLLDFGIAKLRGPQHDPKVVSHTQPGRTIGTPRYMAPEQARGKEVDYRADVYALGVTAYEMFTGQVPFLGEEAVDVMHQHVHAMPPAPSTLRDDLPLQIERLLLQMLEKKPDKRPTLMQIEARLADVRDRAKVVSGPAQVAGSDATPSTPHKHSVLPPRHAETDSLTVARVRTGRLVLGGALVAAVAVTVGLIAARHHAPAATTTHAAPATVTVTPPQPQAKPQSAPAPATLMLTVNVPNASVKLDDELLAESTPGGLFSVAGAGTRHLWVGAPKHKPVEQTITLVSGVETRVDVELPRLAVSRSEPHAAPAPTPRPHHRDDMINPFAKP
jgi:serine/threonine-protein kinase